jgi:hypothetical protein
MRGDGVGVGDVGAVPGARCNEGIEPCGNYDE